MGLICQLVPQWPDVFYFLVATSKVEIVGAAQQTTMCSFQTEKVVDFLSGFGVISEMHVISGHLSYGYYTFNPHFI